MNSRKEKKDYSLEHPPELLRPDFKQESVEKASWDFFGIQGTAKELPGERDRNYLIQDSKNQRFVLKIFNQCEKRELLEIQNVALQRTLNALGPGRAPELMLSHSNENLSKVVSNQGLRHWMRFVKYVDGIPMAEYTPHNEDFLHHLGCMCGTMTHAVHAIKAEPFQSNLLWNMKHVSKTLGNYLSYLHDPEKRGWIESFLALYQQTMNPLEKHLRKGWIQNDANDYNILVQPSLEGPPKLGIIDFGDLCHSYLVADAAVAIAYGMLNKEDPVDAACHLMRGYQERFPLKEFEVEILFLMALMRLCLTVTLGAFQQRNDPENPYLGISQRPAWGLLGDLRKVNPDFAHYRLREACGMEAFPKTKFMIPWLKKNTADFRHILGESFLNQAGKVIDLSQSSELTLALEGKTVLEQQQFLDAWLLKNEASYGIGKYAECRSFYSSEAFHEQLSESVEMRTLHLGIDLFVPYKTPIHTPLEGKVVQLQDNAGNLDYGPTVVLEHRPESGPVFYTLYGHLARECLTELETGQRILAGEAFVLTGNCDENGGWPTHVHFQLVQDLFDYGGNVPGVASPSQFGLWKSLCPDPSLLVGLQNEVCDEVINEAELLERRNRVFGPSLSLSYDQPLTIIRGRGSYLFDAGGQAHLDCVNNVAHVGHAHPKVASEMKHQVSVLNTNTRYLNPVTLNYSERLCSLFPDPLDTCFLVCSGSEANELALRIAATVTGNTEVIVLEEGYHGNTRTTVDASPYKHEGPGGQGPPQWVHKIPMPYLFRGKYRDLESAGSQYADEIQKLCLELESSEKKPSAFICESILGCGGQVPLPDFFLNFAYDHIRKAGGLCIADEVQVGFGRVGKHLWGFQLQNVIPDIVTLGKPIGNGQPLGAVITTQKIAKAFANGMEYFNTFGGSQVSCAAGMAVLDVIEEENLQKHVLETGNWLKEELNRLKKQYPLIGDVRGEGFFLGIELILDPETLQPAGSHAKYVVERLKTKRILMSTEGPGHNVLKFKPPMVFGRNEGKFLLENLESVLQESPIQFVS